MINLLDKQKLEELLLKNWTSFMDFKTLLSLVLVAVRDTEFPARTTQEIKIQTQIKLSRFEPGEHGFTVWVEFSVPRGDGLVVGTSEIQLLLSGKATHIQTIGNLFLKRKLSVPD